MTILIALIALLGPEADYPALVSLAAEKQRQRDEELLAAHDALDGGEYGRAVELATHARVLEAEIDALRLDAQATLRSCVAAHVVRLEDDDFAVRESASAALRALGPVAIPDLLRHRLSPDLPPESRCRLDDLLPNVRVDPQQRLHQWACDASASSEYGAEDWSAKQLIGPPDATLGGDARTAWAARDADAGPEWVRVRFAVPLRMRTLRIFENDHPGAVVKVEVVGLDGLRRKVWEGTDPGGPAPACFEVDLKGEIGAEAILSLDTRRSAGWEEIDAVELIGELPD